MAKPMKTTEALDLLHQGQRVEDVVLLDLETQKLGFRDALLLTENGFVVPAGNIVYQDSDIQYDPDFDDTAWKGEYSKLSDFLASKGLAPEATQEPLNIEITIQDKAVQEWLKQNSAKLERVVNKLVLDLYHTERMLHTE